MAHLSNVADGVFYGGRSRFEGEMKMRIPRLVWNRRHNVAALTVSFGRRTWHTREVGDMVLGFNAAGRLSRVVMLDARRVLAPDSTVADALGRVTAELLRAGGVRQADLDVLASALERAKGSPLRATS